MKYPSETHRGSLDMAWTLFSNVAKGLLRRVGVILIDDVESDLDGQSTDRL